MAPHYRTAKRIAAAAVAIVAGACASYGGPSAERAMAPAPETIDSSGPPATPAVAVPAPREDTAPGPALAEPPGDGREEISTDFPENTVSLEVRALAHVLGRPADRARYIGKITPRTRVAWKRVVAPDPEPDDAKKRRRKPCAAWVEIEPRGYLCLDLLKPSTEPPSGERQPVVRQGRLTPDAYFKVLDDGTKVFKAVDDVSVDLVEKELSTKVMLVGYGVVDVDGVPYRKTDHGLVDDSALARLWPSDFEGILLRDGGAPWPLAWVVAERGGRRSVYREPSEKAERVRRAKRREIVPVLEVRDDFVRIADEEWLERRHVRIAASSPPPPGVAERDQWLDVDLDEQVLVAYEGHTPVFATMVSTGGARNPTPVATYRVRAKAATTPMAGDPSAKNRYEVSGVPWAVRFADGFYVHGVYWHDGFGGPRSHGCVNLSAKDARFVYEWIEPRVPEGWSEVEVPGGSGVFVRVRDRDNPDPPPFDYSAEEPWNQPGPPDAR